MEYERIKELGKKELERIGFKILGVTSWNSHTFIVDVQSSQEIWDMMKRANYQVSKGDKQRFGYTWLGRNGLGFTEDHIPSEGYLMSSYEYKK